MRIIGEKMHFEKLKDKIKYFLTKVDPIVIQDIIVCTKRLIDYVRRYGLIESN